MADYWFFFKQEGLSPQAVLYKQVRRVVGEVKSNMPMFLEQDAGRENPHQLCCSEGYDGTRVGCVPAHVFSLTGYSSVSIA